MASGPSRVRRSIPNVPTWGVESESEAETSSGDESVSSASNGSDAEDGEIELTEDEDEDNIFRKRPDRSDAFERVPYPDTEKTWSAPDGTEWSNIPPQTGRRRHFNKWTARKGGIGVREKVQGVPVLKNEVDFFNCMIDNAMLNDIVKWTNVKANSDIDQWNNANAQKIQKIWKPTNLVELKGFIGLLVMAGVHKCKQMATAMLWRKDPLYKKHAFTATMSRTRFRLIMKYLRFDDFQTREERKLDNKLAAISETVDALTSNMYKMYEPKSNLTVDEMLVKFRGKCGFTVYMKSKPGRYGIKIWAMTDSETRFVLNMQVYVGKTGNAPETNQGKRILFDMLANFLDTGRGVTADNFFGTVKAAQELVARKITSVFTVRGQRREVPKEILIAKNQDQGSVFYFTDDCMMVGYKAKPNKIVLVMSTQHTDPLISSIEPNKPEIILHYNATKGGVDTVDQMVGEYSCQRPTRRWPVKVFFQLIDVAAVNAYIMWSEKNPDHSTRKSRRQNFLEKLAEGLILPQVKARGESMVGLQVHIQESIHLLLGTKPTAIPASNANGADRGFCKGCLPKKQRGRVICCKCDYFSCKKHILKICEDCDKKK